MTAMADDAGVSANKKIRLSREKDIRDELWKTTREVLVDRVIRQQQEIDALVAKQASDTSLDELRETVEKLKLQVAESARQESLLVMRLAAKEQEVQELLGQISELKQALNPSSAQLQSMLLDPAVNLLFVQMKREMDACRSQLEQSQKDLAAWKFTPDSQTGKRLMAKCRMLLQENEELGRSVSSGRLAKLEGDIALQKRLITEMKNSEKATEEFLGDMDEDLEAMQGTVYLLQQELKDAKDKIQKLQLENEQLREAATTGHSSNNTGATSNELTVSLSNELKQQTNDGAVGEKNDPEGRLRTAGKDMNSACDEEPVKKGTVTDQPVTGNHRTSAGENVENMDVDSDVPRSDMLTTKRSYVNASRTSPVRHSNDHSVKTEDKADEGGRHRNAVDRCRTASNRHSTELLADCMPNGTDDDKAVTAVSN